jgi:hypothetical protein
MSGVVRLVATSIFYSMVHNTAEASIEPPMEMEPYFSYPSSEAQPLDPLDPEETTIEPGTPLYFPETQAEQDNPSRETAQSPLWAGMLFPIGDDGQELGRKIGNWVVEKIKNK